MSRKLQYVSTRGHSKAVDIAAAIAAGLAPDGGLYVPEALPRLNPSAFKPGGSLAQTATTLLAPFFAGDPLAAELPAICAEALDFATPLRRLAGEPVCHVLELFHGPTGAFKDVGARFLAACVRRLQHTDGQPLTILVATSGDTGAAVAAAFHRQSGVRVVVLYPDGLVAPRQAHQLGCFGNNVWTFRVAGRFDDCQRMVKAALADPGLRAEVPLSSANSISLGRLLPQMSYYAHAALQWTRGHHDALGFIVPTGNLGNALAALWVRALGLPVGDVHLACNANATLPEFFAGHAYCPRAAIVTLANAMDVGAPSNFERLRWTFPDAAGLRGQCTAVSVDDRAIAATITRWARGRDEVFDPHTACAVRALECLRAGGDDADYAVVATAHPAKFAEAVEPLIDRSLPVPAPLEAMLRRPVRAEPMAADDAALKRWLRTASAA